MSAVASSPSAPLALEASVRDNTAGVLLVRRVPRSTLRALSVLGAERDLSREAFVREMLEREASEAAG